jgi:2-polyprenyl-3-methyl-5-hydroxy-6-metoxy-1,4-benzoquinol methylase
MPRRPAATSGSRAVFGPISNRRLQHGGPAKQQEEGIMIGRRELPVEYRDWNKYWGAPYGHAAARELSIRERFDSADMRDFGPFAFQISNHTREFEYPWAFLSADITPGLRVLDVGGGLGGLQFALALEGCDVTNVDPEARQTRPKWSSFPSYGVPLSEKRHQMLNEALGTNVHLVADPVQTAALPERSFDRVFCLSVLEHVDPAEGHAMLQAIERLLVPGGMCLLTIDLFLDVKPFGVLQRNVWGQNIDVRELVSASGLELTTGDPRELLGFPEWDFGRVVDLLPSLLVGYYSALTQSLILRAR